MGRLIAVALSCCMFLVLYSEQSFAVVPLGTLNVSNSEVTVGCGKGKGNGGDATSTCVKSNASLSLSPTVRVNPDRVLPRSKFENKPAEESSGSSTGLLELGTLALLGLGMLGLGVVRHRVAA